MVSDASWYRLPPPPRRSAEEQQRAAKREKVFAAKRTILAAVDALTDDEMIRLANEIRRGQTDALTGRNRVEYRVERKPLAFDVTGICGVAGEGA